MKLKILFVLCFISIMTAKAQIVSIANETFEGPLSGWTISSTGFWDADTTLYVGGHTSFCGHVPLGNQGDTVVLTSPLYDFSLYEFASMKFSQICKVSSSDICRIEYRENILSSTWQPIPTSSYKGEGKYINAQFNHSSYLDWQEADSLAIPTNNWWKTETFDISNEVSFSQVQFRFIITKGSVAGTHFAYGWLIDNFQLTASMNPIAPPMLKIISNYGDTAYNTGPFEIKAKIISRTYAPILIPTLYYTATFNNITTFDSITMTAIEGDSIWIGNIPQCVFGTSIAFYINCYDTVGNSNSANAGFYIKRPPTGLTGSIIIGNGTLTDYYTPANMYFRYSWARMLYLSREFNINQTGGLITHLAWYYDNANGGVYNNQSCYFKAVDDTLLTTGYVDPVIDGATEVWSGSLNIVQGWVEVTLQQPFYLPPGKHLQVYWHHNNGAFLGISYHWHHTSTSPDYRTIYAQSDASFPSTSGTLTYSRPNARFYIVGSVADSNSVALHSVDNPKNTVFVNLSAQIPVVVTIKNKGLANLDSCYIDWTLNNIPQTRYIWKGNLLDDFNATDTIGYFSPSANQYDTIVAWVSMPNGVYDSTNYDDTLIRITYGMSGLDLFFISDISDTVYTTGPFSVQAKIVSKTLTPLPYIINLNVKYTNNGIDTYDTLPMNALGNDIYEAIIPQHIFGTEVKYEITLLDSLGNVCKITDVFCILRPPSGTPAYVIVGTGTTTTNVLPMSMFYKYGWTRQLYLANELSQARAGGLITKLAWQYAYGTSHTYSNQSCYFRAVSDENISATAYEDPIAAGATLVWSGSINLSSGWSEINLTTPFMLPAGKNLLIYWEHRNGSYAGSYYVFNYTETSDNKAINCQYDGSFPSGNTGTLTKNRPNARFYIESSNDSISLTLQSIDSPTDTIYVSPSVQTPVVVTIKNIGIADLDSCYIDWTLNGVTQPRYIWRGHLPSDFYTSFNIGYYSPQANGKDTVLIWTSFPNGKYDSTSYDDTLIKISHGISGLIMNFVSNFDDTVYSTGPFSLQASIVSRTLTPIPSTINLNIKYTYKGIDVYDTLPMTALGNNIYEVMIPQHAYGTDVIYSITLIDSLGNVCHIYDYFHIKRPISGITGYVIIGNGTQTNNFTPVAMYYKYGWVRMLYLAREFDTNKAGGLITHLAWYYNSANSGVYNNQSCYFKAVDDTSLTTGYVDPVIDGATEVWSGSLNIVQGWVEVTLQQPFYLPSGKHLQVYWHHNNGAYIGSSNYWHHTTTSPVYRTIYAQSDGSFPSTSSGTLHYDRPNARFNLLGTINDSNSVALVTINSPSESSTAGNNPIQVTIKNKGMKVLDSCQIKWTLNGILQTPYVYRGYLPQDFNDTIIIGNYIQRSNMYDTIIVWVEMPNGVIDTITNDDTLNIIPFGCVGPIFGDWIVGISPGADFSSIEEAYFVASKCGVSGDITVKLQNGVYADNWDFSDLSDIMGNYTLTITSLSANRDSVIIRPSSGDVITLNNTSNLMLSHITLDGRSGNSTVNFTGKASNITIDSCNILASLTSTSSSSRTVYKATSTGSLDGLTIKHCLIDGGYSGIYLDCNSTDYAQKVIIDSNIVTNQYYYGIYLNYVNSISTSYNTVTSRSINQGTTWYGIYLNNNKNGGNIIGNKIFSNNPGISSTLCCLRTTYIDTALIANNEIRLNSTASTTYGLYIDYPKSCSYLHNSILVTGTGSNLRSANWYTYSNATYDATMKNNIFVCNGGTTPYAIYLAGTYSSTYAANYRIDYNNYYSSGSIGYANGILPTLADWQSVVISDSNSVNVLPSFVDVNTNLEINDYSSFVVKRISSVMKDIRGDARTVNTSMGAYSVYIFSGYNLAMTAVMTQYDLKDLLCYENYTNIQVVLKNEGTETYNFNVDSVQLTVEVSGAINFRADKIIKTGSLSIAQSDTFEITHMLPISISGIYQIKTYLSSPLDTLFNNDTLNTDFGIHRIQLPYETDFSSPPAEMFIKQVMGTSTWEVESGTGSNPVIAPTFGSGRLTFHSESGAGSIAQAIFNGINLMGTHQPKLGFWYAHDASSSKRDFVSVKISTDGVTTQHLQFVTRYNQNYTTPGWAYYTIDLSAYVNEPCVSLIFEGNSYGGANQNIDHIRISSSQDISLTYLSPKVSDLVACSLDNQTVKVIVSNLTSQRVDLNQDTTNIHFYVSGADTFTYIYPLSGILDGFESDTIEITNHLDLSHNGIHDIIAYLDAIDDDTSNDTIKNTFFINPDLSILDIVGIDNINCKDIGDSVYVSFKIINVGNLTVNEIPLSLQINGVNKLVDTLYRRLTPGEYINYSFTEPFIVPMVSDVQPYYYVKIKIDMPCDASTSNNIKEILACVDVVKVVDVEVLSINHPLENPCDTGLRPINVSVTLSNNGNVHIEETVLHVEVDSAGFVHASFSEITDAIPAKSTLEHVFTKTYLVPNQQGVYKLKVYVDNVSNDENTNNDSLEINPCAIKGLGVANYGVNKWSMGQNIPNPAKGSVDIPFSLQQAGPLLFTIRSITGQIIYTENLHGIEGENMFTCDITAFADGIYYYSMEYQGQRIVKKMTVQR